MARSGTASEQAEAQQTAATSRRLLTALGAEFEHRDDGFETLSSVGEQLTEAAEALSGVERARALRVRSGIELASDPRTALSTLAEAKRLPGSMRSIEDRRQQFMRETLAKSHLLEDVSLEEITAALGADALSTDNNDGPLGRWMLVPWLLVIGETARAREWVQRSTQSADADAPGWRKRQAEVVEEQLRIAEGRRPVALAPSETQLDPSAIPIAWVRVHVRYFWHLIDGDVIAARRTQETIRHLQPFIPAAYRGPAIALASLLDAISETAEVDLPVPQDLSLYRLGAALAGGEAVAIGGTQENAARWYSWFRTTWPAQVLRGPIWPVLADRVRALLACRAGDPVAGLAWMEQTIAVADRIGSPVESAIARVQYAELLALDPQPDTRERWKEIRQSGLERCRVLGISHEHHAHRARSAATQGRFDLIGASSSDPATPRIPLTRREIEVLRLFRKGHSYREAAEELDVGWRTVQSHAYNAYQKLEVSSKIAALSVATRLRLL